ncbi:MAG: hypothetical protein A3K90_05450 [Pelodictyon luteolum]|uniref:Uncharacterized protein n=2 Tax=Pelodictyon luteolum TaxID=1100 RepID=Q3B3S4_CHLL3|nr:hypothetical protein [Pelodictyon luteolum]ABB24007.1 hypothetical protein Plut_1145 [Pelodictyon luteolum DSM 273]KZK75167.1 MAG: hypothetical protein A3K90_05450 [Pelodictyon luteolum]
MKNNSAQARGAGKLRLSVGRIGTRIFLSILRRLFPALRAPDFISPPPLEVFSTSPRMLFTSPRMARAILQHRRPEACFPVGMQEKPADPLWDPFGYGYPYSLNSLLIVSVTLFAL